MSSSTITPKAFWQDIGQSNALPIGYAIDFVFPIFESDSSVHSQIHYQNQVTNVQ